MGGLARILNRALAPADVAFTRRTTLDRTRSQLTGATTQVQILSDALAAARAQATSLEAAIAGLHASMSAGQAQAAERLHNELAHHKRLLIQHQIASRWSTVDAMERLVAVPAADRTCPLCGHRASQSSFEAITTHCIFGGGVLTRHRCPECEVIFGADKMFALNAKELSQEYEWHYMVYEEGDSTEQEIRAFHSLAPRKDGRYVNFGAGAWSRSVQVLRQQGWDVYAYEPHSSAASPSDWLITSESALAERPFDGLFSNNVLEHFRHPVQSLIDMKRYLKPGAVMAHATPCYEYLYEYTRFHLFFFTGRSRQRLAQLAGLSVEHYEQDGHYMNCVFAPSRSTRKTPPRTLKAAVGYDPDRPLVFVHVPKTAGNSVMKAVSEGLGVELVAPGFDGLLFGAFDDFQSMAPELQSRVWPSGQGFVRGDERFVVAHMALSTFRAAYPDAQFFTVLRKPDARAISLWLYWRAISAKNLRPWGEGWAAHLKLSHRPLSEFLSSTRIAAQTDNIVLRTLLWPHPLIPNDGFIQRQHDEELLALAVDQLSSLDFVGVIEDHFAEHLSDWLGTALSMPRENVTGAMPEGLQVDLEAEVSRASALLRERSRLDDVLWQMSLRGDVPHHTGARAIPYPCAPAVP